MMIAYWFPPESSAAAYRPLRFLRNLPSFDWEARVVTGGDHYHRYDEELLKEIPAGTEVLRVAHGDLWQRFQRKRSERQVRQTAVGQPGAQADGFSGSELRSRLQALVRKAESIWYHPDMQKSWIHPAVAATVAACARRRADVLWATGPPWSAFFVAKQASQLTGIPYVLDFRTSWTIVPSPLEAIRPGWAQRRDRRALGELFRGAHAVTFFYAAEAECFWRMYRGELDPSRIHVIPNGFDGDIEPFALSPSSRFTILYTGTVCEYRYDTLLDGIARFVEREPSRADRVRVEFIGESEPQLLKLAAEKGLSMVVSSRPPLPNKEVERRQREAHALLMLERKPDHKGYELLAGAKLFGYFRAGRPILGVVPEGEASRILRGVGVSSIANAGSVDEICQAIETLFNAWSVGELGRFVPDRTACLEYSATAQTQAMARALAGLPPLQPFVPGAVEVVPSLRAELSAAG